MPCSCEVSNPGLSIIRRTPYGLTYRIATYSCCDGCNFFIPFKPRHTLRAVLFPAAPVYGRPTDCLSIIIIIIIIIIIMSRSSASRYSYNAASCTVWGSNPCTGKRFSIYPKRSYRLCPPGSYPVGTGILSLGLSDRGVKLSTHLHPVSRLGISGAKLLLPRMPSGFEQGKHYYYYYF